MCEKRTKKLLVAVMTLGLLSCATTAETLRVKGIPEGAEAAIIFKKDGAPELFSVNAEEGIAVLQQAERCTVGEVPEHDTKAMATSSYRNEMQCPGLPPNKGWVRNVYSLPVLQIKPNPHACWYCYYVPDGTGGYYRVCVPRGCDSH